MQCARKGDLETDTRAFTGNRVEKMVISEHLWMEMLVHVEFFIELWIYKIQNYGEIFKSSSFQVSVDHR